MLESGSSRDTNWGYFIEGDGDIILDLSLFTWSSHPGSSSLTLTPGDSWDRDHRTDRQCDSLLRTMLHSTCSVGQHHTSSGHGSLLSWDLQTGAGAGGPTLTSSSLQSSHQSLRYSMLITHFSFTTLQCSALHAFHNIWNRISPLMVGPLIPFRILCAFNYFTTHAQWKWLVWPDL